MVRRTSLARPLAALAFGLTLMACEFFPGVQPVLTPQSRPTDLAQPAAPPQPSAQSEDLRRYYRAILTDGLTRGLLRTDGGGPDTPYSDEMLARNFEAIAFFDEYAGSPDGPSGGAALLRRWRDPVRVRAVFGASVTTAERSRDEIALSGYLARLARVTRHPISRAGSSSGNFLVFFVGEDDKANTRAQLEAYSPKLAPRTIDSLINISRGTYCLVVAFENPSAPSTYDRAIAIIRTEQPDLMRLACIHEELAQGLGLSNDSPLARPSIFNDDDEFALLTSHDEHLLSILYDPRLRPGLSAAQAGPLVRQIAREKTGGGS